MNNNRKVIALLLTLSFLIGAGGMYVGLSVFDRTEVVADDNGHTEVEFPNFTDAGEIAKIEKAYRLISERYVEEIEESSLVEGAIRGMLETLDDPYSVYMDEETATQFIESLDSHFQGIGAEVSMTNGKVTIVAPFRDSPAEDAGLRPNDQIIKIDGESIEGLSLYEAVLKIRGEKGTTVTLTIEREGLSQPTDVKVVRDDIPIETVRVDTIEREGKTFGKIEITSFSEDTAEHFEEQLKKLEKQGIDGLIIDVRGNPGGYLNSVEDIGRLIIPGGEPIVQIENRAGERVRQLSTLEKTKDYPIVALTDGGSASASEILAAALKEAGGYDVVGETTFGKGTVQQPIKMGDGSEIKLTLYRWLTSDGNNINQDGVDPTVEVKQPEFFYVAPLNVEETLVYDMNNEQVKNAQQMLKGLGFEPGRSDGYFGEQTKIAVQAFQQTNGLSVTGEIDEQTAGKIQEELIKAIRNPENDRQLQTAIELLGKKSK
ncbi:S41 family peptidase [Anaerobacillus sp. MEB173]|uniref:S41 family peptidase n=1 Tax=Anaerobacillus sp. MEB173 TaxID=3383345 RepID=UPI003F90A7F0